MNINFGRFGEEEEDPPINAEELQAVKNFIETTLKKLKLKDYTDIYVANPHQCFMEDFLPKSTLKDTLEIYFYSAPEEAKPSLARIESISSNGSTVLLREGQKEAVKVETVPAGYKLIEDDGGQQIALVGGNKFCILCDLLHNVGTSKEAMTAARETLRLISDLYFNPPTDAELRQRAIEKVESIIKENFGRNKKVLEDRVKQLSSELQERERQLASNVRTLAYESELLELANKRNMPKAEQVMHNIEKMAFVKKVSFKNGSISISTHPITIGPFNYGSWNIILEPDCPRFKHEASGFVRHPYEYDHTGFCMGGFANNYVLSSNSGEYDKALTICRLEITNYSTSTKMRFVEDFLKKIMGAVAFNKILRAIKEEHFPESDGVIISNINGSVVTFVATKTSTNGQEIATVKSVDIDYAK